MVSVQSAVIFWKRVIHIIQYGISEPVFYDDLVYKSKLIVGKPNFSDHFKKINAYQNIPIKVV